MERGGRGRMKVVTVETGGRDVTLCKLIFFNLLLFIVDI